MRPQPVIRRGWRSTSAVKARAPRSRTSARVSEPGIHSSSGHRRRTAGHAQTFGYAAMLLDERHTDLRVGQFESGRDNRSRLVCPS